MSPRRSEIGVRTVASRLRLRLGDRGCFERVQVLAVQTLAHENIDRGQILAARALAHQTRSKDLMGSRCADFQRNLQQPHPCISHGEVAPHSV